MRRLDRTFVSQSFEKMDGRVKPGHDAEKRAGDELRFALRSLVGAALLAGAASIAPALAEGTFDLPAGAHFNPQKLERIGEFFRNEIADGKIPGAIVLIQQHGKPVYFEKFGVRDVATELPMTDDTIFTVYSMSKPVTSVAAMMLVDEGKLKLSDPLEKYIPSFATAKVGVEGRAENGDKTLEFVPLQRSITILDLMRHTSGHYLWLLRRQPGPGALFQHAALCRRFRQRRIRRPHREAAAGGAAGHAVGLRPFHRRAGPRHRSGFRQIAAAIRKGAAARSARHDRHRFLHHRSCKTAAAGGDDAERQQFSAPAAFAMRAG